MIRGLLSVVVVAIGLVLVSYTPAHACSCVMGNDAKYLKWSDVAFNGTLTDTVGQEGHTDTVTYVFSVDRVFKGDAAETTEVWSSGSGASCGLEGMQLGREYAVFASYVGAGLSSGLCDGTRRMDGDGVAHMEDRLGIARPPSPGVMRAGAADEGGIAPWMVAGPGLLLAVGAGALVWRRRRS